MESGRDYNSLEYINRGRYYFHHGSITINYNMKNTQVNNTAYLGTAKSATDLNAQFPWYMESYSNSSSILVCHLRLI